MLNLYGRVAPLARGFFGLLTLAAIGAQVSNVANAGVFNPVNFFSYFTIQSNLIGAAVLLYLAMRGRSPRSRTVEMVRGAATVYLTITFTVVIFLLKEVDVGLQLPWVDVTLHEIVPVVVVADWLLDPPSTRITSRDSLLWLSFPVVWLAYTLIRGPIAGWYPYPFLDPANGGYASVAVIVAPIFVAGAVLCVAYAAIGNALAGRRSRTSAA
jgi:hypothetical protein